MRRSNRRGSSRDKSDGEHRSRGNVDLFAQLTQVENRGLPQVTAYAGATKTFTTDALQDRIMTGVPGALQYDYPSVLLITATSNNAFQGGTNPLTSVNVLTNQVLNLYNVVVRQLIMQKRFALRDTTLVNSGTVNSFGAWLSAYGAAFMSLRTLQGVLQAGNYNFTIEKMSAAITQNIMRLEADIRRLYSYSVPPMFIRYLDRLCGVFTNEPGGVPLIAGLVNVGSNPLDLTLSASIVTILGTIETQLDILSKGSASFPLGDAQAIANIMAIAYGEPVIPSKKAISFDTYERGMIQTQVGVYVDTVATKGFGWPNTNPVANLIPVLVPKQPALDPEVVKQYFSLIRTPIANTDPVAGLVTGSIPNNLGLFANQNATTAGTVGATYNQSGTFTGFTNTGAAAGFFSYTQPNLEFLYWVNQAGHEETVYTSDQRSHSEWNVVYVSVDQLVDETSYILEDMFLSPLRSVG